MLASRGHTYYYIPPRKWSSGGVYTTHITYVYMTLEVNQLPYIIPITMILFIRNLSTTFILPQSTVYTYSSLFNTIHDSSPCLLFYSPLCSPHCQIINLTICKIIMTFPMTPHVRLLVGWNQNPKSRLSLFFIFSL